MDQKRHAATANGDHRLGRRSFVSLGLAACHFLPDVDSSAQPDFERTALSNLSERLPAEELTAFLGNPQTRAIRMAGCRACRLLRRRRADIAAYLLLWSKPIRTDTETAKPPSAEEIAQVARRLGVRGSPQQRPLSCARNIVLSAIPDSVPASPPIFR